MGGKRSLKDEELQRLRKRQIKFHIFFSHQTEGHKGEESYREDIRAGDNLFVFYRGGHYVYVLYSRQPVWDFNMFGILTCFCFVSGTGM
jgi:hypothetical protein